MIKRKIPALARLCWIAAVVFLSASCSKGDDVEAVRKLIDKGVVLGEKHDIGELMK